ncbi:T9SS type A sorting domain-containing protein [Chryseobacterium sp. OV279]|uniref:T9SS type A sorting domain-containing protein n=1 Tax=Chryseobacterium sp. OV279 TaxID=1500285 RepID=UPI0009148172|nr:T9SS type A sorting domain-containing protein [Chryseobacterium sp. OV279]SHE96974.1 Por secretion system C-terminal sorting domain-containing protein [Chryseobacterium sp. OV279]
MKKIISFLACLFFLQGFAQSLAWWNYDSLQNMYSYSLGINRVDGNGNVYLLYSATPERFRSYTVYIEKYTPQGARDSSFGANGVLNLNTLLGYSSSEEPPVFSFEVTESNKVLLLMGTPNNGSPKLLRLNGDGTVDQSYGTAGTKQIFTDPLKYSKHYRSGLYKVGTQYFISHNYSDLQDKPRGEIGCFNESGELQTGMFDQGLKQIDYGSTYAYTQIQSMVVSGSYLYVQGVGYIGSTPNSRISRIEAASGIQDNAYVYNPNLNISFNNTYIFPDGKAVVGNSTSVSSSRTDLKLKKYRADGTVDTSFGTNGELSLGYPWISLNFSKIQGLPNGDFIVGIAYVSTASSGNRRNALIYVKSNGEINSSFGGNIPNNGIPIPGFFGLIGYYGYNTSFTLKPEYLMVTASRSYMGTGLATCRVNFNYSTLSSDEVSKSYTFSFHPNPVKSVGTLTVKDNSEATFSLSDSSGKLIFRNQTFRNKREIDFSMLTSGVYYLNIKQKDKESTQKIIKE